MKEEEEIDFLSVAMLENKIKIRRTRIRQFIIISIFIIIFVTLGEIIYLKFELNKEQAEYAKKVKSTLFSDPIQEMLDEEEVIDFKGVKITKIATYDITGKVFGMEHYSKFNDVAATISPEDLALCWGPAVPAKDIGEVGIIWETNDRKAHFTCTGAYALLYGEECGDYMSNNHIIPMNNVVKKNLERVQLGDTVQMLGWLVYCEGENWTWGPSSLVRTDIGCEIILVEYLGIVK